MVLMTLGQSVRSLLHSGRAVTIPTIRRDRGSFRTSGLSALDFRALARASSTNLGTLSPGDDESRGGSVGRNSADLFKFRLRETSRVSLGVTIRESISSRYIRGAILDDDKGRLKQTDKLRAPFGSDDFSLRLQPGTYYIKISTDGKKISYDFDLSVED